MKPQDIDVQLPEAAKKQKKKHTAAKKIAAINVLAVAAVFLGIALYLLLGTRPTESEIENRNLAGFPAFSWRSYFSGHFTEELAAYYNDTVPDREVFKNLSASLRQYMGLGLNDITIHGNITGSVPEDPEDSEPVQTMPVVTTAATGTQGTTAPAETTTVPETTAAPPSDEDDNDEGELSNNILIYKNRGIMLYGGSHKAGERYASSLNAFKADLGPDVNVYSMVIPTPCSYYMPEKYQYLIGSEQGNIDHINGCLNGVTPIDAYGALGQHTEEQIFMRTDHHWGALGAFYAAQEFARVANVPFRNLDTYEKVTKSGYVGTLYGYSGDIKLKNNPEDFSYYVPSVPYTTKYYNTDMTNERTGNLLHSLDRMKPVSWYLVFIGSDEVVTHVTTEVGNGRTLCIIKDSYGNALAPYFTGSFSDIYVIDMRYFKLNAVRFLKEHNVTDVLFAMNTFSATGGNSKKLEVIRTQ